MTGGGGGTSATGPALETEELAPALAAKLAANATFAPPGSLQEGVPGADDEFLKLSTPGDTVPAAAVQKALNDWKKVKGRAKGGKSDWKPLGPTDAQGLDNEYRDRGVYNAGTPDFSGRIAHVAIEPGCRRERSVHPLDRERERWCLAHERARSTRRRSGSTSRRLRAQQHRLDRARPERQAEPRRSGSARASRTRAAPAARRASASTSPRTRGNSWTGPVRSRELQQPRGRLDRRQARRLEDDLRRLGPCGPRRLERLLRRRRRAHPGRPALRALPLDERRRVVGAREPGRTRRSAPRRHPTSSRSAARPARRVGRGA